jgi:hypothetical protein
MYKLAVVPKVHWIKEYSSAFGSQHDFKHIKKCLKSECFNVDIDFKVTYERKFLKNIANFDGVIFLGLSARSLEFVKNNESIDKYVWSFNQFVWPQNKYIFDNVSIVFEQSTRDLSFLPKNSTDVHHLPLAFQGDRFNDRCFKPKYDIVFNGTLYRNRRLKSKNYRRDVLELLLKKGVSIINNNGRSKSKVEKALLSKLVKYDNFKVVDSFGDIKNYHEGFHSLDLPFLDTGTDLDCEKKSNMSWDELENSIWLNHWDIFRSIGSKANIITFDSPSIKLLGLNDSNTHFYKSTPNNIINMSNEIENIVKNKKVKMVTYQEWHMSTYQNRWNFIINKIRLKKSLPYKSEA